MEFEGGIVVTLGRKFKTTYYKPAGQPQLILRQSSKSDSCSRRY